MLTRLGFVFLYLIHFLPIKVIWFMAEIFGFIAYYLAHRRRRIGAINLAKCFPEKTEAERKHILKRHFFHMMAMILELSVGWYGSDKRLYKLTEYKNKHYYDDAVKTGRKIIILYPHFCALETVMAKCNQDIPLISIYSQQKNKIMDARVFKGRHRYNNIILLKRTDSLLTIIRAIKKKDMAFLYLPDQDLGEKDSVFVPFFGIPTATVDGLSRIAKLTNAIVVPAVAERLKNGRFRMTFYPPFEPFPTDDTVADTAQMNAFIEERIREIPEQYYWLHKRFKTRPNNEPSFYD